MSERKISLVSGANKGIGFEVFATARRASCLNERSVQAGSEDHSS
jgi:hypothetical protein